MRTVLKNVRRQSLTPLLFLPLNGTLTGRDRAGAATATGAGAVRYFPAQGARTNLLKNPRFGVNTSGWLASSATVTQVADASFAGGTAAEVVSSTLNGGIVSDVLAAGAANVAAKTDHLYSCDVKLASGATDWQLFARFMDAAGGPIGGGVVLGNVVPTANAQRFSGILPAASVPVGTHRLRFVLWRQTAAASTIRVSNCVIEQAGIPGAGTPLDGTLPGAAWLDPFTGLPGTAHASPSVSASAVLVEEGTTNVLTDPIMGNAGTTQWAAVGGGVTTLTKDAAYAYLGTTALKIATDGAAANQGARGLNTAAASGQAWSASAWLRAPATATVWLSVQERDAGNVFVARSVVACAVTDQWQRFAVTATLGGATTANVTLEVVTPATAAVTVYLGAAQLEQKAYATTPCAGSLGTGYTWAGTAHASSSTRAATSIQLPTTNHLASVAGAAAAWANPSYLNPSGFPAVFVGGTLGAGTDQLLCYVNGTNQRFSFERRLNNVTGGTAPPTAAVVPPGAWTFGYAEWAGQAQGGQVNGGPPFGNPHPTVPTGSLGAGALGIGGTPAGGTPLDGLVGPLLVFDRPLTQAERSRLLALGPAWAWDAVVTYPPC